MQKRLRGENIKVRGTVCRHVTCADVGDGEVQAGQPLMLERLCNVHTVRRTASYLESDFYV